MGCQRWWVIIWFQLGISNINIMNFFPLKIRTLSADNLWPTGFWVDFNRHRWTVVKWLYEIKPNTCARLLYGCNIWLQSLHYGAMVKHRPVLMGSLSDGWPPRFLAMKPCPTYENTCFKNPLHRTLLQEIYLTANGHSFWSLIIKNKYLQQW